MKKIFYLFIPFILPSIAGCNPTKDVNPIVITDQNEYSLSEGIKLIDEAIVDNYKTIYISPIRNLNNPIDIENYLEIINSNYDIASSCKTTYNNKSVYKYIIKQNTTCTTSHDPENPATKVVNANLYLRKYGKTNLTKLPIDDVTKTKTISNSDQLWWAVEHGYKPVFSDNNSSAKKCYEKAREICLDIIKEEYDEIDIVRSFFDYMTSNMKYNNWVASSESAQRNWRSYPDYFLEGPLLNSVGVCDGFSKVLALFGGIMQINTSSSQRLIRSFGYSSKYGHAWNYYCPKNSSTYYLICPTWGQSLAMDESGKPVYFSESKFYTDYKAFMTKKSYFYDFTRDSTYNFSDYPWPNINKSTSYYSLPTGLESQPPVSTIKNITDTIDDDFVLNVAYTTTSRKNEFISNYGSSNVFTSKEAYTGLSHLYVFHKK